MLTLVAPDSLTFRIIREREFQFEITFEDVPNPFEHGTAAGIDLVGRFGFDHDYGLSADADECSQAALIDAGQFAGLLDLRRRK